MRPPLSARAIARHATRAGGFVSTELHPYDLIVADDSRRSTRVYAQTEAHARRLAAETLRVEPARLVLRPDPYSLVSMQRVEKAWGL